MSDVPMAILRAHQLEHQSLRAAGMAGFGPSSTQARRFLVKTPSQPIAIPSITTPLKYNTAGLGDVYGLTWLGDVGPVDPNTPVTYGVLEQALSDAQTRQLIYAAVGGVALVALGGVVTYFITRR